MVKQISKEKERENAPKRSRLSVQQKLELSQMMRQEQDYNRYQMGQREMFVYGAGRSRKGRGFSKYTGGISGSYGSTPGMLQAAETEEMAREQEWEKEQKRNRVSLMIRGFLSVLLFVIVLLMRFENLSIGGVDYQNLIASLQSEEFIKGIDFEELIPYTNEEQVPPEHPESSDSADDAVNETALEKKIE